MIFHVLSDILSGLSDRGGNWVRRKWKAEIAGGTEVGAGDSGVGGAVKVDDVEIERGAGVRAGCYAESVRKPEIMSPAGYWPQLRAAVEAGADAVYFGLKHFTARAKVGFEPDELPEVMRTLHRRGVKGYVTFNTLVFDTELDEAARALGDIAAAGADSIIVQDWAAVKMAREIAPGLDIHGSTQMSITSADGVRFAQSLGVKRVVMARELSLDDVRAIRAAVDCELEMFVHGALCVSYSGQCFSSEAWGGRSANRGQCAQACRLPYELMVDGKQEPLGDARYLLSPGDLYALRQIPEIVQIGISALKIEGRYKDADYVALTTRAYRQAVDDAWAGRTGLEPATELQLEQVYSRGLGPHFMAGTDHQTVVKGRAPRHRGVLMGRVTRVGDGGIEMEPSAANVGAPLKPGDGVVFDAADWRSPQEAEEGGRVFEVAMRGGKLEARLMRAASAAATWFGGRTIPILIRPCGRFWKLRRRCINRRYRCGCGRARVRRWRPNGALATLALWWSLLNRWARRATGA
jgi:putative protease